MKDISPKSFRNSNIPTSQLLVLTEENFAHNSILISLCTNLRSDLRSHPTEASGWWADEFTPGDEMGSSLFTLARSKPSDETLDSALLFAQEGLEWLKNSEPSAEVEIEAHFEAQDLKIKVNLTGSRLAKPTRFEVIL